MRAVRGQKRDKMLGMMLAKGGRMPGNPDARAGGGLADSGCGRSAGAAPLEDRPDGPPHEVGQRYLRDDHREQGKAGCNDDLQQRSRIHGDDARLQVGLSRDMRRMRARISESSLGRPQRRRDFRRQRSRAGACSSIRRITNLR
jgi:hypothetical protein